MTAVKNYVTDGATKIRPAYFTGYRKGSQIEDGIWKPEATDEKLQGELHTAWLDSVKDQAPEEAVEDLWLLWQQGEKKIARLLSTTR